MHYIEGHPRDQMILFSETLDDIIEENNPVRVIDVFVNNLDLDRLKFKQPSLRTGTPPYKPQLFLKIYIYGYMEKIRTSRKLEKECQRNKELQWLTEGLVPDFKTISNFRKNNTAGLKKIFTEFLHFCKSMDLLDLSVVGVDGTKIRASNSMNNIYKRDSIDKTEEKIQSKIDEYLSILEETDQQTEEELKLKKIDIAEIQSRLKHSEQYLFKVQSIKKKFEESPELETYYSTDPDSRLQSDKGKIRAGYNPQIIVESKNKLIVGAEITNEAHDINQLDKMTDKVMELKKEVTVKESTTVIFDAGYYSEKGILATQTKKGLEIYVSNPKEEKKKKTYKYPNKKGKKTNKVPTDSYTIDKFQYDADKNIYICPEGKSVLYKHKEKNSGRESYMYQCQSCQGCAVRAECTTNKVGRTIRRSVNAEVMDSYNEKMQTKEGKQILSKRKELVEHPFGTLKRNLGYTYFLLRGTDKVSAEFKFMGFVYNFKRVINILGAEKLIKLFEGGYLTRTAA